MSRMKLTGSLVLHADISTDVNAVELCCEIHQTEDETDERFYDRIRLVSDVMARMLRNECESKRSTDIGLGAITTHWHGPSDEKRSE